MADNISEVDFEVLMKRAALDMLTEQEHDLLRADSTAEFAEQRSGLRNMMKLLADNAGESAAFVLCVKRVVEAILDVYERMTVVGNLQRSVTLQTTRQLIQDDIHYAKLRDVAKEYDDLDQLEAFIEQTYAMHIDNMETRQGARATEDVKQMARKYAERSGYSMYLVLFSMKTQLQATQEQIRLNTQLAQLYGFLDLLVGVQFKDQLPQIPRPANYRQTSDVLTVQDILDFVTPQQIYAPQQPLREVVPDVVITPGEWVYESNAARPMVQRLLKDMARRRRRVGAELSAADVTISVAQGFVVAIYSTLFVILLKRMFGTQTYLSSVITQNGAIYQSPATMVVLAVVLYTLGAQIYQQPLSSLLPTDIGYFVWSIEKVGSVVSFFYGKFWNIFNTDAAEIDPEATILSLGDQFNNIVTKTTELYENNRAGEISRNVVISLSTQFGNRYSSATAMTASIDNSMQLLSNLMYIPLVFKMTQFLDTSNRISFFVTALATVRFVIYVQQTVKQVLAQGVEVVNAIMQVQPIAYASPSYWVYYASNQALLAVYSEGLVRAPVVLALRFFACVIVVIVLAFSETEDSVRQRYRRWIDDAQEFLRADRDGDGPVSGFSFFLELLDTLPRNLDPFGSYFVKVIRLRRGEISLTDVLRDIVVSQLLYASVGLLSSSYRPTIVEAPSVVVDDVARFSYGVMVEQNAFYAIEYSIPALLYSTTQLALTSISSSYNKWVITSRQRFSAGMLDRNVWDTGVYESRMWFAMARFFQAQELDVKSSPKNIRAFSKTWLMELCAVQPGASEETRQVIFANLLRFWEELLTPLDSQLSLILKPASDRAYFVTRLPGPRQPYSANTLFIASILNKVIISEQFAITGTYEDALYGFLASYIRERQYDVDPDRMAALLVAVSVIVEPLAQVQYWSGIDWADFGTFYGDIPMQSRHVRVFINRPLAYWLATRSIGYKPLAGSDPVELRQRGNEIAELLSVARGDSPLCHIDASREWSIILYRWRLTQALRDAEQNDTTTYDRPGTATFKMRRQMDRMHGAILVRDAKPATEQSVSKELQTRGTFTELVTAWTKTTPASDSNVQSTIVHSKPLSLPLQALLRNHKETFRLADGARYLNMTWIKPELSWAEFDTAEAVDETTRGLSWVVQQQQNIKKQISGLQDGTLFANQGLPFLGPFFGLYSGNNMKFLNKNITGWNYIIPDDRRPGEAVSTLDLYVNARRSGAKSALSPNQLWQDLLLYFDLLRAVSILYNFTAVGSNYGFTRDTQARNTQLNIARAVYFYVAQKTDPGFELIFGEALNKDRDNTRSDRS